MDLTALSDEQASTFDTEYVTDGRWQPVFQCIQRDFPEGSFRFLDVGGGNGVFTDRVLAAFPRAYGTLLDTSEFLLSRNRASDRKKTVLANIADWRTNETYDIVFCNWVLHHLITRGDYRQTRGNISKVLRVCGGLLTERGRLSIYENDYNGVIDWFPGRAIFALTSSIALAPFVKKLGANTAGVGVCFLSHRQWLETLEGFPVLDYTPDAPWSFPWWRAVPLLLREVRCAHYWVGASAVTKS